MAEKQFQYEVQPYQEDCIGNIIGVFDALQQNQSFCNVLTEHYAQRNYHFPIQDSKNIDIMMETGTGKTFTFIKTMFELNKKFGYKKFIILIPSVPIREGTKTNMEDTKEYFKQFYANEREKEIEVFVYESGQISSVRRFIATEHLSVLIMTPSSFDKDKNILNRPLENEIYAPNLFIQNTEPPKSYLDCLKRLNPIVIMDEPHRFDGDAFKKYFEGFNNYYLRFGATFPKKKNNTDTTIPLSNVAYTLDSISSFRQNLVKKIVVYTQDIVRNQDSLVKIEKEGSKYKATVNTLSNGAIVKKVLCAGDIFNGKSIKKINANNIVLSDDSIEKVDYSLSDEALRSMIRETIKIHFEKEQSLFEQGIKALSLFFIESDTELYRGDNPKIKIIFEEEYLKSWKIEVERLKTEVGSWEMEDGEKIVSLYFNDNIKKYGCTELSKINSVAEVNDVNKIDLLTHKKIAERGDLLADKSDETCSNIHSVEYCGGTGKEVKKGVYTVFENSTRFEKRIGNTVSGVQRNWLPCRYGHYGSDEPSARDKPNVECPHKKTGNCPITSIFNLQSSNYLQYLQNDFDTNGILQVNEGYFSGDKGNADEKIKAGVDLILKDKKKLLSFESPTRFIFSIWALQEGWDNPNVFTICKLSNQGSEISKLQQIGRGLRICVDQNLKRHTIKEFGDNQDNFWKVNNLDVVVSNLEIGFVEAIQNEILSNSLLVNDTFTEQELKRLLKEKNNFDDGIVRNLFKLLDNKEMIVYKQTVDGIDIYEKSPNFAVILKEQNLPDEQRKALESLFASDYKNFVQEKSKIRPKKNVVIKEQHLAEFQKLWNTINRNAFYMLENLDNESEKNLIVNIKAEIEALNIDEILLQTIRKELHINKIGENDAITAQRKEAISHKSKVVYLQFVSNLSNSTGTPISFIVKIFNALSSDFKNKILANNPAQALKEMTEIVRKNLVSTIKTKIRYDGIDGAVLPNVFLSENNEAYIKAGSVGKYQKDIDGDFSLREKWIFKDVIEYDSDFEVEIIEQDPDMDEIEIFGKLPKLKIKTPLGEYSPDFCYAVKSTAGNKLILIVESKGYKTYTAIPQEEKGKIEFAKKYFEYLNEHYKNKNIKISFKERISNTQLAALIV